jgi:hypothetical protein
LLAHNAKQLPHSCLLMIVVVVVAAAHVDWIFLLVLLCWEKG